jgi:hypothetical protein
MLFFLLILLIMISDVHNQAYQSLVTKQRMGTDFIHANPIELLATSADVATPTLCPITCNRDILCRTLASDGTWHFLCRLYQGLIDTGTIIRSSSLNSIVAGFHCNRSFYSDYYQACNLHMPAFDRYLVCVDGFQQCPESMDWDRFMCTQVNESHGPFAACVIGVIIELHSGE